MIQECLDLNLPFKVSESNCDSFGDDHRQIPSRELTYPTLGKGTSSSKGPIGMGYVSYQEGRCFKVKDVEEIKLLQSLHCIEILAS